MSKRGISEYYDGSSETYHKQYDRELLNDVLRDYPANYFRMQILLNSFVRAGVKRVFEVGVGEGTPLANLCKAGMSVSGIDLSHSMVEKAKATFTNQGLDAAEIRWGDIEDTNTYIEMLNGGRFDALLAMGVMPHVNNTALALNNMKTCVRPGGRVFIEFRNKLFSLFSLNRHTVEFIVNDLLAGVDETLRVKVEADLKMRLRVDQPEIRSKGSSEDGLGEFVGYDVIKSDFHNPFEILELFEQLGFVDSKLRWYHYHPAMPYLRGEDQELYRRESIKLEHENSGWRGMFLCSAFVVEAVVGNNADA